MKDFLVSVITATWERDELLLDRCIPSIQAQAYDGVIEHVIVSDGPNPGLRDKLPASTSNYRVKYIELSEHTGNTRWGVDAKLAGLEEAEGEFIAYLDDDNEWRPNHVSVLSNALTQYPDLLAPVPIGFAYSYTQMRHVNGREWFVAGALEPTFGAIDVSAIMHRSDILELATWRDLGPELQNNIDFDLIERWLSAGVRWNVVPTLTVDFHYKGYDG